MGTAGFDRDEDHWPRKWAEAYVAFAAGEKRSWLRQQGVRLFPIVGWAERVGTARSATATRSPGSTSPGGPGPAWWRRSSAESAGPRRGVWWTCGSVTGSTSSTTTGGTVDGVRGAILEPSDARRGTASSRTEAGEFALTRAGGGRHVRRDRRQSRSGAGDVAGAPRRAAEGHAQRRPGARRRPDAGHHRGCRRFDHQSRPDVALHRGHRELGPDLEGPRHPDPAGPLVDVVRRAREPAPGAAVSRLRHAGHPGPHHADRATTTPGSS